MASKSFRICVQNTTYKVRLGPSVFLERNNDKRQLEDVRIMRANRDWGAVDPEDGLMYTTAAVFAAESGAVLRSREALPPELNFQYLRAQGILGSNAAA